MTFERTVWSEMGKQNIQAKKVFWLPKGGGDAAVAHYGLAFGCVINPLFLFRSIAFRWLDI